MKNIAIIAPTGMLGSMVYNVLQKDFSLILIYKDNRKLQLLNKTYGGVKNHKTFQVDLMQFEKDYSHNIGGKHSSLESFIHKVGDIDAIINCGGVINSRVKNNYETIFLNSVVPHIFSNLYRDKLIHITTDCVFSGKKGEPYVESDTANPVDLYGLSKSIGEPSRSSLVLRTSIIGPEIGNGLSLLEWVKSQKNKTVYGYTNHLWNGITTKEFGKICKTIIMQRSKYPKNGLYHIFSTDISKYEMIKKIAEKYEVPIKIIPKVVDPIDRRLRSIYSLNGRLDIPPFDTMLAQL